MDENEIKTMEWPAQIPDSNIIENVWLKIKIELQIISETADSRNQLYDKILQIWTNISVDYIRHVYSSIPKRMYKGQHEVTSLNIKVSQSSLNIFYILSLEVNIKEFLFPV